MSILNFFNQTKRSFASFVLATFVSMPAIALDNSITAGGRTDTNITIDSLNNITEISGGINANGTSFNHFDNFNVGTGWTVNQIGADRYVNMVNNGVNIDGIYNAIKNGGGIGADTVFISPQGFAVGANGILNIGSLQSIVPTPDSYNAYLSNFNLDTLVDETKALNYNSLFTTLNPDANQKIEGAIISGKDISFIGGKFQGSPILISGFDFATHQAKTGNNGISSISELSNIVNTNGWQDTYLTKEGNIAIGANSIDTLSSRLFAKDSIQIGSDTSINMAKGTGSDINGNTVAIGAKDTINIESSINSEGATNITLQSSNNGANLNVGDINSQGDVTIKNSSTEGKVVLNGTINKGTNSNGGIIDITSAGGIDLNNSAKILNSGTSENYGTTRLTNSNGSININGDILMGDYARVHIKNTGTEGTKINGKIIGAENSKENYLLVVNDNGNLEIGQDAILSNNSSIILDNSINAKDIIIDGKIGTPEQMHNGVLQITNRTGKTIINGDINTTGATTIDSLLQATDLTINGNINSTGTNTRIQKDSDTQTGTDGIITINGNINTSGTLDISNYNKTNGGISISENSTIQNKNNTLKILNRGSNGIELKGKIINDGIQAIKDTSNNGNIIIENQTDTALKISGNAIESKAGSVTINSYGDVILDSDATNIKAYKDVTVKAGQKTVGSWDYKTHNASILNGGGSETAIVAGRNLKLEANGGNIGEINKPVFDIATEGFTKNFIDNKASSINIKVGENFNDTNSGIVNITNSLSTEGSKNTVNLRADSLKINTINTVGDTVLIAENGDISTTSNSSIKSTNDIYALSKNGNINISNISGPANLYLESPKDINIQGDGTINFKSVLSGNIKKADGTIDYKEDGTVNVKDGGNITINVNGSANIDEVATNNGNITISAENLALKNLGKVQRIKNLDGSNQILASNILDLEVKHPDGIVRLLDAYVKDKLIIKADNVIANAANAQLIDKYNSLTNATGDLQANAVGFITSDGIDTSNATGIHAMGEKPLEIQIIGTKEQAQLPNIFQFGNPYFEYDPNATRTDRIYLTINESDSTHFSNTFNKMYSDYIYVDVINKEGSNALADLNFQDVIVNKKGTFQNAQTKTTDAKENKFRVDINNVDKNYDYDLATATLYTAQTGSFQVHLFSDPNQNPYINTTAPIIFYNPRRILNMPHTENSFQRLTLKSDKVMDDTTTEMFKDVKKDTRSKLQRKDIRWAIKDDEHRILSSSTDSGANIINIVDISKNGMLIEASNKLEKGEKLQMEFEYKGLAFVVDGEVVRIDRNNLAGVKFTNFDEAASSMILYISMLK